MKIINILCTILLMTFPFASKAYSGPQAVSAEKSPIGESGFAARVSNQVLNLSKTGVSNVFSNDIPAIYYFAKYEYKLFSFRGMDMSKRYRVEWIVPNGTLYEKQQIGLASGQNEFMFTDLKVAGTLAAEKIGVWTVRLYEHDKLLDEKQFKLEPAGLREKKLSILATEESEKAEEESVKKTSLTVTDIVEDANPYVGLVVIINEKEEVISTGSGFLIGADGRLATNYHVIAHAASGIVKFPQGDMYIIEHIIAADQDKDLAILKIDMVNKKFLGMGASAFLKAGQPVIAIGSPLALANSVSTGIVSSMRDIDKALQLIQITTPISPGSSGGPLLDYGGKVVGITSMGVNPSVGQNINFAVPVDYLKELNSNPRMSKQLIVNEKLKEKLKGFRQVVNKTTR